MFRQANGKEGENKAVPTSPHLILREFFYLGWISTNLVGMADRFKSRWLVADYEAGDMVIHSPYMIHAATLNRDPLGRTRLSTDIRYQRAGDLIDQRWAQNWVPGDNL